MRSSRLALTLAALAAACSSDDDSRTRQIAAYDTLDSCTAYQDEESCLANADRCVWYALGIPCAEGEPCVSGVCQDIDPCRVHTDSDSCTADSDNNCAWAAVELCPGEDCGDGGFCYQMTDEQKCTCVCPLTPCAEGEECPPCECDCPDDDGGNTCTCTGTVCPDGDPDCVPVIDCTCQDDGGGGDGCGTCTCSGTACPADDPSCVPEPIECTCEDTSTTCVCPECAPGETCPPCDCAVPPPADGSRVPTYEGDPCLAYSDEATCAGDPQCAWLQNPCPLCPDCAPGVECDPCTCDETFSCRYVGDSDCTCVCPTCAPGEECPPCECTCGGGSGCGEIGSGGGSTGGSDGSTGA
jgi:hypothetical protein